MHDRKFVLGFGMVRGELTRGDITRFDCTVAIMYQTLADPDPSCGIPFPLNSTVG